MLPGDSSFGFGLVGGAARISIPLTCQAGLAMISPSNTYPGLTKPYDKDEPALFGVLNATRRPGAPPFTPEDLEYLTRFAGQLSIAVANSMAFAAERERSEQIAVVNAVMREISGTLSPERVLETAARRIHEAFQYPVVAVSVADPDRSGYRIAECARC